MAHKRNSLRRKSRSYKKRQRLDSVHLRAESLEARVLLDASNTLLPQAWTTPFDDGTTTAYPLADSLAMQANRLGPTRGLQRHEIVFVDEGVKESDALLADLVVSRPNIFREIIHVSAGGDGLQQIADAMQGRANINAIHILSHGDDAKLYLGNAVIDASQLKTAYVDQLATVGRGLAEHGDILIYGCNFGKSAAGRQALDDLARLTSADVAGSEDATGHVDLGGDWDFEYRIGSVETPVAVSAAGQAHWSALLAPTPQVGLSVPAQAFIGDTVAFTATFDNTGMSGETGYGPFIDLVFPVNGADGAAGTDTPDGLDFVNATYLGSALTATELVFPDDGGGTGTVDHPYAVDNAGAPLQVTGVTGDKLVVLQLPFGSFVPGQPTLTIDVTAQLSNLADPYDVANPPSELNISARAGFRYGADPLDNPAADPSILSDTQTDSSAWLVNSQLRPTLLGMDKIYSGPEHETATGPNFIRSYTIRTFLATGQTLDNLTITDFLPNTYEFAGNLIVTNGGAPTSNFTTLQTPATPGAQNAPDNDLVVRLDDPVVGAGPGTPAATVSFDFFVPLDDANGLPVNDPTSGDDHVVDNDAAIAGDWQPTDSRDPLTMVASDATLQDHQLEQQSIAIQKGVVIGNDTGTAGITPGDELEYALNFQVSDFFAFNDVMITDQFSDGQDWYLDHSNHGAGEVLIPTLEFTEHGTTVAAAPFSSANYTVTENADGTTTVIFDVSQELIDRAGGASTAGELLGGWIASGGTGIGQPDGTFDAGATTGRIVFRTEVLEDYKNPGGADPSVDQGDSLNNNVSIDGALLNVNDLSVRGTRETDNSSAAVTIVTGQLGKSIYAINGFQNWQTVFDTDNDGTPEIESGDLITYRIDYSLPTSDVEDFELIDFLPLPVFDATSINPTRGTTSAFAPGEYQWHLHPDDTFTDFFEANVLPGEHFGPNGNVEIVNDSATNSFNVQYGTVDDPASMARKIDILVTVPIVAQPAADGLFYTNQAQTIENRTFGGSTINQVISMQDLLVYNPDLSITKGAVTTSSGNGTFAPTTVGPAGVTWEVPGSANPAFTGQIDSPGIATTPIDSDVNSLDAGDLVKFAITLENTGNADAYDITVADILPPGFQIPTNATGLNLEIRDGNGNLLSWSGVDTGNDSDLFGGGIEIYDPTQVFLSSDVTDSLTRMDSRDNFDPATNETTVGPHGVPDIEGMARDPFTGVLYAADADTLGTIDLSNGAFTAVGGTFGTANGSLGNVTLSDVDGLSFRRQRGELYGVHDAGAQNVIFKIDTSSGGFIPNAFGTGNDYIALNIALRIDDIAIDRAGTIFGTDATNLLRLDLDELNGTGTVTTIGAHGSSIGDLEGLSVDEDGRLWGTTGNTLVNGTENSLWEIDPQTGSAFDQRQLDNGADYEGSESYAPGSAGAINDFGNAQSLNDGSNLIILTYDLQLTTAVEPNTLHTNNATLTNYSAQDGEINYADGSEMDSATAMVTNVAASKSVVSTSEAHTSGTDVAIGEIVRYRLQAQMPEGTSPNLQFRDRLPAGMTFLNDNTAMVAFVSDTPAMTSTTLSGAGLNVVGNETTINSVTPTFVLPGSAVSANSGSDNDTYNSGTDVYFKMGDLVTSENDDNAEFVVIEFNAILDNDFGTQTNDAGETRNNRFDVQINNVTETSSANVGVQIHEPSITDLMKVASPASGDAGDTVTFTITYSNANGADNTDAFEARLRDLLPGDYTLNVGSVNITLGGGAAGITNSSAGNTVDVTIADVPIGGLVTVTYTATLNVSVQPGDILTNTATLSYTSLPGANGTTSNPTGSSTPGVSGSGTGERDGSDGINVAPNDYAQISSASVTVNSPTVTKSLITTSIVNGTNAFDEAVIGETVQYQLDVTIPEGSTNVAQVIDTLDAGLSFVSLDGISTSAGVTSSNVAINLNDFNTIPTNAIGQDVTFDFGDLTNSNNSNATPETITLSYTALVQNIVTNQGEGVGTMLDNSAVFAWQRNGTPTQTTSATAPAIEVIEPELEVIKNVSAPSADAGDSVTFTIAIQHAAGSDTDAFDVTFSDPVPAGINYTFPADVSVMHSTLGDISTSFQQTGQTLETIPGSTFDVLLGETVTVMITGVIGGAITPGVTLTNAATADWTSLNGTDPNERDGADGAGGALDDYEHTSTASVTATATPTVSKALLSTSINSANNASDEVVIGETAQYQVTVTIPEATIPISQLVDDLDLGLQFISLDSIQTFSAAAPTSEITSTVDVFTNTASFDPTVTGDGTTIAQQLTFDFGTLVNANRDNTALETLVLTYTARVTDIAANTSNGSGAGTMLDNSAVFAWDAGGAPASTPAADAADIEVIEPALNITKTVSDDTPFLGQTVTYTLVIDHTAGSDADAHDIVVTDALPAALALNLGSLMVAGATVVTDTSAGNNINLVLDQLALGNTITITYDATVTTDPMQIGTSLNNTGGTTWTSLPDGDTAGAGPERDGDGGAGGADDYADSSNESATITHPLVELTKTLVGLPVPASSGTEGNYDVTYDLRIDSTGNDPLVNLSLVEDLATQYGGAFIRIVPQTGQPATIQSSSASDDPEINSAFDGGATFAELIDNSGANTNLLAGGEAVTIRIIIEVDPNALTANLQMGDLVNQATVTGTGQDTGLTPNDLSDDPNDPTNAENDVPPDTEPDDPNRVRFANISLDKQVVGTPTPAASGTAGNFEVFYELTITNAGSTPLDNVTLVEDFVAHFGGAFVAVVPQAGQPATIQASTATDDPGINAGYDGGLTATQIFDGSPSLLNVNESITVRILVEIDPDNATAIYDHVSADGDGDLENQAATSGEDPTNPGVPVSDLSDDPTDPTQSDPNGDNSPDDPTALYLPSINLTKTLVGAPVPASGGTDGNFDVTYDLAIINTGNEPLDMLSLTEDISTQYAGGFVRIVPQAGQPATIQTSTATDNPEINAAYDGGTSDAQLFDNTGGNTNLLGQGAAVTIRIIIEVDPNDPAAVTTSGNFVNQANVNGTGTVGGAMVSDASDDPNDPTNVDPNSDNNPDDPNTVRFPTISLEKQVIGAPTPASSGTAGNYDVFYDLTITNTGSTPLDNLTLVEDFVAHFGGAFVAVVLQAGQPATIQSSTATDDPGFNASYDGGLTSTQLFDGTPSLLDVDQSITIRVLVELDPDSATAIYDNISADGNGDLENRAATSGEDPTNPGVPVSDLSDDPTDPTQSDPNGDNSPDDPTALYLPSINLTKTLVGAPVPASSGIEGNFDVTYDLAITNTGNEPLDMLSLSEDISTQYGGGFVQIVSQAGQPATMQSTTASDVPEINTAYDGGTTDSQLFDNSVGNTNLLDASQSVTVRIIIEVDPNNATAILSGGNLVNQADVTGSGTVSGTMLTDASDDPADATNGDPNSDNNPDDPNRIRFANVSLEKRVFGAPTPATSGTPDNYDVFYDLTITNTGSTPLDNLTLVEDFAAHFGGAFVAIVPQAGQPATIQASTATVDPGINASYDGGLTATQIFDGSPSLLDVNQSIRVRVQVEVDPDNPTAIYDNLSGDGNNDLENQALTSGEDPLNPGVAVTDLSDDPTDPTDNDVNGDNDPDDPTALNFAAINLTKTLVGTPVAATSGTSGNFDVTYDLAITNTGNEPLNMLRLVEDVSAEYGGAFVQIVPQAGQPATIQSSTAADNPEINTAYDGGTSDAQLFDNGGANTNLLNEAESVTVRIVFEVDPDSATATLSSGDLVNQANVEGTGTSTFVVVNDDSDDPSDPTNVDPNMDANPDDPNRLSLPAITINKIITAGPTPAASGTAGNFDVTYELTVTNTGSERLTNLTLTEDLQPQLGGAFINLTALPMISAGGGAVAPVANGSYDGGVTSANLLDGISGELDPRESFVVSLSIEVDPDSSSAVNVAGELENQATATGTDEHLVTVTDESDDTTDGTNVDPNMDNNPDDPTGLSIPDVELLKSVGIPSIASSGFPGNLDVPYQFVITNTGTQPLSNLTLIEDLAAHFGGGFVSIVGAPTISASGAGVAPNLNPSYDGGLTNTNVFDATSGLIPVGETVTVDMLVEIDPDNPTAITVGGTFVNQAAAGGTDPNLVNVTDLSDDPNDPTDVENETPSDNDPDDLTILYLASITVTKTLTAAPVPASSGTAGNFDVSYDLVVTNDGTTTLQNLALVEDLATHFGGNLVGVVGTPTVSAGAGAVAPNLNSSYDGGLADSNLFDGVSGELDPMEIYTVQIVVEIDADADPAARINGGFVNQVTVGGTDTNMIPVSDESDDLNDLTDVDPDLDGEPDDPTFVSLPDIEVIKQVTAGPTPLGNTGNVQVEYTLIVTNTGSEQLTDLAISEDLSTQLGGAMVGLLAPPIVMPGAGALAPTASATYDGGLSDANLLNGTSGELDPGETYTVVLQVEVDPDNATAITNNGAFENQAVVGGTGENGGMPTDLSDDPTNATDTENETPGDNEPDDPTAVVVRQIGLAKDQVSAVPNGDNWDAMFTLTVTNYGGVTLSNLDLAENISAEFGPAFVVVPATHVINWPAANGGVAPTANTAWPSDTTQSMLNSDGVLLSGESFTVNFTVTVDPDATGTAQTRDNQATVTAEDITTDPINPVPVTDDSDGGIDPVGTNSGQPGDMGTSDDPTPLEISDIGVAKQVNTITEVMGLTGVFDIEMVVVVENTGTVDLSNLQVVEDMGTHYGAGYIGLQNAATIVASNLSVGAALPNLDPAWDGTATNPNLLDGASGLLLPGDNLTIVFTVRLDTNVGDTTPPMDFTNQVVATGDGANGVPATDDSDNGTNPNTDNGIGGTNDPTPALIPQLRTRKTHGAVVNNGDGTFTIPVMIEVLNSGTVDLTNLSLVDDIASEFGMAFVSVANPVISPVGTFLGVLPQVNPAWGTSNTSVDMLDPAQTNEQLDVGEIYEFTFDVTVDPDSSGTSMLLFNQALAMGDGPNFDGMTVTVTDESGSPNFSHPSGVDNDEPTPLYLANIAIAKEQSAATKNTDGTWDIDYTLVVENVGATALAGLDLFEDIASQFGPVFVSATAPVLDDTGMPNGVTPTQNLAWTGDTTQNMLGNDGLLPPGEFFVVTFTTTVNFANATSTMPLENQATTSGTFDPDPMMVGDEIDVTDISDNGTNPNNNNGIGGSDDPTPLVVSDIELTKSVSSVAPAASGTSGNFDVTYTLTVMNTGTQPLTNLSLSDDFQTQFGGAFVGIAAAPVVTNVTATTPPNANASFTGAGGSDLLDTTSGLVEIAQSFQVTVVVELDPDAAAAVVVNGDFQNTAIAIADATTGSVADQSDSPADATDVDPDMDNDPDDPTVVAFADLTVTKAAALPTRAASGTPRNVDVAFTFVVTNTGSQILNSLSLTDDLATQFGGAFVGVVPGSLVVTNTDATNAPAANIAYDGTAGSDLLAGSTADALASGQSFIVSVVVELDPFSPTAIITNGQFFNSATASAIDPIGGPVSDISDDPANPTDVESEGDNDPDDPTAVPVTDATIGAAKESAWDDVADTATINIRLEHLGTIDASNLSLQEDLDLVFGAGNYSVSGLTLVSGPSTLNVNSSFNGSSDQELLGAGGSMLPGETAHVQFIAAITEITDPQANGLGFYQNQVTVVAENFLGDVFTDLSTDGTDPDPNNDGDPTDNSVPSYGTLTPDATVGLAKNATLSADSNFVTVLFSFENFGNTAATGIGAVDSLPTVFGTGGYVVTAVTRPSGPATFLANGMFDGGINPQLVAGGSSLLPGETATIEVVVDITNVLDGSYVNFATVTNMDLGGNTYMDDSQDGLEPDLNLNDDPTDDNVPTVIEVHRGAVSGTVYADFNNNGIQDAGEPGIPDVEIILTGVVMGMPVTFMTTTDPDGNYIFGGMRAGDYTLTQTQPEAFLDGIDTAGSAGGTVTNDQISFVLTPANNVASGYNFGEAGLNPFYSGKDPFLASNQGGSGSPSGSSDGAVEELDPVTLVDGVLTVPGTLGDDQVTIALSNDQYLIRRNFVLYDFAASDVDRIDFDGRVGYDELTLVGSRHDDQLWSTSSGARLTGDGYRVDIANIDVLLASGGGGNDFAMLHDSEGDDLLDTFETSTRLLRADGSRVWVGDTYETVHVVSSHGGEDRATLHGTAGADQFVSRPQDHLAIFRNDIETHVIGFAQSKALANDEADRALFYDTSGEDTFVGRPQLSSMIGVGFDHRAFGFIVVSAYASEGAADRALLYDSDGNDWFVGRADSGALSGNGFSNRTFGFEQVKAHSSGQAGDISRLYDSAGNDHLTARPEMTMLVGQNFDNRAIEFRRVYAFSTTGGVDSAEFYDSAGDDEYVGRSNVSVLRGAGFENRAYLFEHVSAIASAGGVDSAALFDSALDDEFVSRQAFAILRTVDNTQSNQVTGFAHVDARSGNGGNDVATFLEARAGDHLLGRDNYAKLSGSRNVMAINFDHLTARTLGDEIANVDIVDVDYLFSLYGIWS